MKRIYTICTYNTLKSWVKRPHDTDLSFIDGQFLTETGYRTLRSVLDVEQYNDQYVILSIDVTYLGQPTYNMITMNTSEGFGVNVDTVGFKHPLWTNIVNSINVFDLRTGNEFPYFIVRSGVLKGTDETIDNYILGAADRARAATFICHDLDIFELKNAEKLDAKHIS